MKFKLMILALSLLALFLLAASPEFQSRTPFRNILVRGNSTLVGDLDVDGTTNLDVTDIDGAVDMATTATVGTGLTVTAGGATVTAGGATVTAGAVDIPVNQEHIGVMSVITATVPYTPATGTVATVGAGELWLVHKVFIKTDTNFDCTGNDCTLQIGDGNDANGFISAVDASIQAAFTEATGYTAGYYGIEAGSGGAYTLDDGGPFVYAATDTIDYAIGGTDPAAGSATAYVLYTRVY